MSDAPRAGSSARWPRRVALVALLGAIGGAGWYASGRTVKRDELPTLRVERTRFVRRVTAEGNLRAVKATPVVAPREGGGFGPMKIAWIAADGIVVAKGDVVVRFDPTDPEKKLASGQADLAAAEAKISGERIKSTSAVQARDSAAELARAELEQRRKYQSTDEQIFSRNAIVESEIDEKLAGAKQDHAERTKEIERRLARSKAGVLAVEKQKAELTVSYARRALAAMELAAPHDGILVLRRNWRGEPPRVGEQVWPGQKVAEIPLVDAMEAEVFVLEVDGSGLAEAQPAELVVESRPSQIFQAKVKLVDKLAKPRLHAVPVQYFAVVLELAKTEPEVMKPGQRVRATVVLDSADAIVVPRQAIATKDGKSVVYRKGQAGFDPVEVELGAGTSGRVVVTKGLAPGDVIALRDPTRSLDQVLGSGSGTGEPGKEADK